MRLQYRTEVEGMNALVERERGLGKSLATAWALHRREHVQKYDYRGDSYQPPSDEAHAEFIAHYEWQHGMRPAIEWLGEHVNVNLLIALLLESQSAPGVHIRESLESLEQPYIDHRQAELLREWKDRG